MADFLKRGHEAERIINGLGWVQEELQGRSEGEYDQNTMYTCPKLSVNKSRRQRRRRNWETYPFGSHLVTVNDLKNRLTYFYVM